MRSINNKFVFDKQMIGDVLTENGLKLRPSKDTNKRH